MSKTVYLFCKEQSGSYDMRVLEKLKPVDNVILSIQPMGGKGGHRAYGQGFSEGVGYYIKSLGTIPDHSIITFRDRDFDFKIPDTPSLIQCGGNTYAGYRTTIENYLLHPQTLFAYVSTEGTLSSAIQGEQDSNRIFEDAARQIMYFQACRHTLGSMRIKTEQHTNFMRTVSPGVSGDSRVIFLKSGELPPNLDEDYCLEESLNTIRFFRENAELFSEGEFEASYRQFRERFSSDNFFSQLDFLHFFNGKDLAKSLSRILPDQFSFKRYYDFAIRQFNYDQFPDLVELRQVITNL